MCVLGIKIVMIHIVLFRRNEFNLFTTHVPVYNESIKYIIYIIKAPNEKIKYFYFSCHYNKMSVKNMFVPDYSDMKI